MIEKKDRNNKKRKIRIFLGYSVGFLIIVGIIYIGGIKAVKATFSPALFPLILCFFAFFLLTFTSSFRWGFMINKIEDRRICSYHDYFFYFVGSSFSGQYISRIGGDLLLRVGLLSKKNEITLKKGLLVVLLEKIIDILFVFFLVGPALLYVFKILPGGLILTVLLIILLFLFFFFVFKNHLLISALKKTLLILFSSLKKIPLLKKLIKESYFRELKHISELSLLKKSSLFSLLGLTLLRHILLGARVYLLSEALNLNIPAGLLFAGIPILQASLIFSLAPDAFGFVEGGWLAILALAAIPTEETTVFLIGHRVYWFIFTSIIFLVTYLVYATRRLAKMGKAAAAKNA